MAKAKKQKRDSIRAMSATSESQRVLDLLAEAESAEQQREPQSAKADDDKTPPERPLRG